MIFSDTIVALSSGRLPAGVAVIRVSGSQCRFVVETISGLVPEPRLFALRALKAPDGRVLDSGLVVFFPGPHSFTGEDVAEFQVHGGRAVVSAVLEAITNIEGVRHAEQGEFTRRAFLNGKVDLVETEALADLINAETEAQRWFAVMNAGGAQSDLYLSWRRRLIHARAMIEAEIDFSDEEDVLGSVADTVWADVAHMIGEIGRHIDGFRSAEIIRDGFDVVIVGAPNAGKSSLFNALAKREAAIVTDQPGTTRDLIELSLDIGGLRIRLTDTAGLREAAGEIEAIGIERARTRAKAADLLLVLEDAFEPVNADIELSGNSALRIGTKADLLGSEAKMDSRHDLTISVEDGRGLDQLLNEIGRRAAAQVGDVGEVLPSRLRHVELLNHTKHHLEVASRSHTPHELRAEELRLAADQLGRIVGAVDVEDLLDVIFSQFCIGK